MPKAQKIYYCKICDSAWFIEKGINSKYDTDTKTRSEIPTHIKNKFKSDVQHKICFECEKVN